MILRVLGAINALSRRFLRYKRLCIFLAQRFCEVYMSDKQTAFSELTMLAIERAAIKKLIFSRPTTSEVTKASARLCENRGRRMLAVEYSLPGNTVSQKNFYGDAMREEVSRLLKEYGQANLITSLGDAEWKLSKSGKEALLGADKLQRKLMGSQEGFEAAIESLDKEKNYILSGKEEFLIRLGISSKDGRVHDKKQGKFRQINRFLEHIEDVYSSLPKDGEINVFDLCCGKSYLSFAVYYYLTAVKGRRVKMLGVDLKRDVILWCERLASELGFDGMRFLVEDVTKTPADDKPHMVISLHACDIATDIVINTAIRMGAEVILSTPCCHRYLNDKINASELLFVTKYPHLRNKLCEAVTDAIRAARLEGAGYSVSVMELTDPDDTPKNTLIRAIRKRGAVNNENNEGYEGLLSFILGDGKDNYLKGI